MQKMWVRSPGEGNSNPFQYSCLGNPMDRGAWRVTVCEVASSQTWLSKQEVKPARHPEGFTKAGRKTRSTWCHSGHRKTTHHKGQEDEAQGRHKCDQNLGRSGFRGCQVCSALSLVGRAVCVLSSRKGPLLLSGFLCAIAGHLAC